MGEEGEGEGERGGEEGLGRFFSSLVVSRKKERERERERGKGGEGEGGGGGGGGKGGEGGREGLIVCFFLTLLL